MELIKNKELIHSHEFVDGVNTFVIKDRESDKIKLSDVFNYMPAGMVIKDETGMGATYPGCVEEVGKRRTNRTSFAPGGAGQAL